MFRKTNRIISSMLLLSFILLMKVPAMAATASANLIPDSANPDFENGPFDSASEYGYLNFANNTKSDRKQEADGNWYLEVTLPDSTVTGYTGYGNDNWSNFTIRGFDFEEGYTYAVAYDIRLNEASDVTYKGKWTKNGDNNNAYLNAGGDHVQPTLSTAWQRTVSKFTCSKSVNGKDSDGKDTTTVHMSFRPQASITVDNEKKNIAPKTFCVDNIAIYKLSSDDENLVENGVAIPTGTDFITNGTATLHGDGSDGVYSMKFTDSNVSNGSVSALCRYTNITGISGGAIYELSADIKLASSASGVKAYMTAQYANNGAGADGESVSGASAIKTEVNNASWTKVKRLYVTNAAHSNSLHVGINLENVPEGGCDVLVDNVVVKQVAAATEAVGVGNATAKYAHSGTKLSISITPEEETTALVLFAEYDGSRLADVKLSSKTLSGKTIALDFDSEEAKNNSVVYVWEKDTLNPVINKIDLRAN